MTPRPSIRTVEDMHQYITAAQWQRFVRAWRNVGLQTLVDALE